MAKKERIPLSGPSPPLNDAFSQLELSGLPDGPAEVPDVQQTSSQSPRRAGRCVLRRETAHRGGKSVVIVERFEPYRTAAQLEEIGRELKKFCGVGGTVKDGAIEVQGGVVGKVRSWLEGRGYRVAGER